MRDMPNARRLLTPAALASALLAAPALAQDAPLRGPDVPEDTRRTIVHHTMTGQFRPVEGRPAEAALSVMDLDAASVAAADAIVRARAEAVRMLLVDEIDTVREITEAIEAGEGDRARELLERMRAALDPERARDPLLEPLADLLGEEAAAELRRIVDEYWDAWLRAESGGRAPKGGARAEAERRLSFSLFQEEVRDAYDYSLRRYREALEDVYEAVEPTQAQRETIRGIVIEHVRATRLEATPAQRRAVYRRIYESLDERRRARLFDHLLRRVLPDA